MTYWKSKERRLGVCCASCNPIHTFFFFFFRKILQESRNFSLPLQHVEDIDMRESRTSAFLTLLDRSWTEPNLPNYRSSTWSQQLKHLSQHLGHTTLGTTTPLGVPKHSVQGGAGFWNGTLDPLVWVEYGLWDPVGMICRICTEEGKMMHNAHTHIYIRTHNRLRQEVITCFFARLTWHFSG